MRERTLVLALTIATGLALAASVVQAQERRSIVGQWSTEAGRCAKPLSMIAVGPKSLSGEDFSCDFDRVGRRADTVTFRGACTYGADAPVKETVVARLAGDRLYYGFRSQKGENGPFRRCP